MYHGVNTHAGETSARVCVGVNMCTWGGWAEWGRGPGQGHSSVSYPFGMRWEGGRLRPRERERERENADSARIPAL